MSDWRWLDEISEMLRPQSKLRVVFHPTGRDANEDLYKLIACIKTLRAALVNSRSALGYAWEDYGDQYYRNVRDDIDEALEKCAEGEFDE